MADSDVMDVEIKQVESPHAHLKNICILLLDIEGTTASINFVKEILFTYVRTHLQQYVADHWNEKEFQDDVAALQKQADEDVENLVQGVIAIPPCCDGVGSGHQGDVACSSELEDDIKSVQQMVVKNVLWQMDHDRKTTALKQLQGHIWKTGYHTGELKGHIYPDVLPALKKWTGDGKRVYIYSSGSVEAQKLLFSCTEEGNLLEYLTDYFDTGIGMKREVQSYRNIIKAINCKPSEILFLTDIPQEALAAEGAGLHTMLVVRDGNFPLTEEEKKHFGTLETFDDLTFSSGD